MYCWITLMYSTIHPTSVLLNYSPVLFLSPGNFTAKLQHCIVVFTRPVYKGRLHKKYKSPSKYSMCHHASVLLSLYCWITVLYSICHKATVLLNYSTVQHMSQDHCTAELQYWTVHVTRPLYCWITVLYSTCHMATVLLYLTTIVRPLYCHAIVLYV